MSTGYWWRNPTSSDGNVSTWHFVIIINPMCTGLDLKPGLRRGQDGDWLLTPWHGSEVHSRHSITSWVDSSFGTVNGQFSRTGRVTGYVDVMVKPVTEDTVGQWQPGMGTGLGQNGRVGRVSPAGGKYSGT